MNNHSKFTMSAFCHFCLFYKRKYIENITMRLSTTPHPHPISIFGPISPPLWPKGNQYPYSGLYPSRLCFYMLIPYVYMSTIFGIVRF